MNSDRTVPVQDRNAERCRPARSFWRATIADGGIAFVITAFALYMPVLCFYFVAPKFIVFDGREIFFPAMGTLVIVEAFLFRMPKMASGEILVLAYTLIFGIVCWAATLLAYRRSRWWTISTAALLFGLSYFGCVVMHALWAM